MRDEQLTCDAARFALWPDPRTAGSTPEVEAARAHVAQCPSCRAFFTIDAALAARLAKMRQGLTRSDDLLRARIRDALDPGPLARRIPRGPIAWAVAAVAVLAVAAVLVITVHTSPRRAGVAAPLVAVATRAAPADSAMDSSDSAGVAEWLGAHVGMPIAIPAIHDARLVGGRLARIDRQPVAIVVYHMHGAPLVYVATPSMAMAGQRLSASAPMLHLDMRGYQVAIWGEPGGARAIVAPMTRAEVHDIAIECREMTTHTS